MTKVYEATDIGTTRPTNEDSLACIEPDTYIVADGMGGHKAGDIASRMAVLMLGRVLEDAAPSEYLLRAGIEEINELVYERQMEDEELSGMGTTITVLWEGSDFVLLGHVGDSRAYLRRRGTLNQISQDHSMVGEMVRQGVITKQMAERHPYRNIITKAIGTDQTVEPDILRLEKHPGDQWLLCTDGLTGYVKDDEIAMALERLSLDDAADVLLQQALDAGGGDNVSFVLTEVTP